VTRTHRSPHRRAVTLVEVLVTIGVTVILTLILITGLRAVRGQTLAMKDLQNLRLSGQDMLLWSTDNDDKFLNFEDPTSDLFQRAYPSLASPPLSLYMSMYFAQYVHWPTYLAVYVGERREYWQTVYRPTEIEAGPSSSPVTFPRQHLQLSPTLHTSSSLWTRPLAAGGTMACAPYIKVVRMGNIAHPSRKGVLAHLDIPQDAEHAHCLFADQSASRWRQSNLSEPAGNPRNPRGENGRPVLHTFGGYEGVDR
jgi:hypothetical protein